MKKILAVIVAVCAILMSGSIAYASDGDLDYSWGGTGIVISAHDDPSVAYTVANYPDGRILAVGSLTNSPSSTILINRYLTNGALDPSCGVNGEFLDTGRDAVATDVVVLVDGSFVITGTMQIENQATLFLAKFTSTAPSAAPARVPRPPTATQMTASMELAGENSPGLMMPTCGT